MPDLHFNPLPPHGGRLSQSHIPIREREFQSTPSAWRETEVSTVSGSPLYSFQSTPSAWRETVLTIDGKVCLIYFNPLPPHGGRLYPLNMEYLLHYFNPLPPHGGRLLQILYILYTVHFNPLPPHGGRHNNMEIPSTICSFQSTPSAWRETFFHIFILDNSGNFNPLPPHGGRLVFANNIPIIYNFNPLPPHGGRQNIHFQAYPLHTFQSTPSAWRETGRLPIREVGAFHFNPLPPHGGRRV